MDWYYIVIFFISAYAVLVGYLYIRKPWGDHLSFYGPIVAVKTFRVRFLDRFIRFARALRIYGSVGVVVVGVISVLMALLLVYTLQFSIANPQPPTSPQNILLIPGLNEYVPLTFSVLFGLFLTVAIHEFGHGILCRVEGIRVKSMGVLFAVIPLGFFVEPDEEDLEKSESGLKMRMFGAGIMNNMVVGLICVVVVITLIGMIVPPTEPIIHGVYQGSPAYDAGVQPNSVIQAVNGIPVNTTAEITSILSSTRPGDTVTLTVLHDSMVQSYRLTLAPWPGNLSSSTPSYGFMGVYYYQGETVFRSLNDALRSPMGLLYFLALPFSLTDPGSYLRMLVIDTVDMSYFQVPTPLFWGVLHLFFWTGWISLVVGTFNAIPMVPLDGGLIMKEGIGSFFRKRGWDRFTDTAVLSISWVMLFLLISLIAVPYLFRLMAGTGGA